MTTVEEIRENCNELELTRKEELKSMLNNYFKDRFIKWHRPWRATKGNKETSSIKLYRTHLVLNVVSVSEKEVGMCYWPNFSIEKLCKELENLGFVFMDDDDSIAVPAYQKGQELTFAQEWVKKINYAYSEYCSIEKEVAKELYSKMISGLSCVPIENQITADGYTLFSNFAFETVISKQCRRFLKRLMKNDGIEEYYDDEVYKGIRVLHKSPN